jgi:hypothetical protein
MKRDKILQRGPISWLLSVFFICVHPVHLRLKKFETQICKGTGKKQETHVAWDFME